MLRILVIGTVLIGVSATPAAGQRTWTEVRSPNFIVVSDSGDGMARSVAWQFEQVRAAVHAFWPWANVDMERPFVVLAVRNEDGMKQLAPKFWETKGGMSPASVSVAGPDRQYVALRTDVSVTDDRVGRANPYTSAYWSYGHAVIGSSLGYNLPLWFSRGLSGIVSNTIVTGSEIQIGRIPPQSLEQLSYRGRLRLSEMFDVDRQSQWYTDGERLAVFDAQASTLLHFLMFGENGARREQLAHVLKLVTEGQPTRAAVEPAFGSLEALESAYVGYLTKKTFGYSRLDADVSVKREGFAMRTLAPAEAAALRAAFHAAMARPVEARALLAEALKADPNSAAAHEVEGVLFDAEQKPDAAREAYGRAVDQETSSFYAKYRWAWLTWRLKPEPDTQTLTRAQRLLEQSARQNTRFLFTYALLAEVKTRLEGAEAALPIAVRAVSLAPSDSSTRLLLARVLWALSRQDEAQQEAKRALTLASTDFQRKAVQNLLFFFERNATTGQPAGAPPK